MLVGVAQPVRDVFFSEAGSGFFVVRRLQATYQVDVGVYVAHPAVEMITLETARH